MSSTALAVTTRAVALTEIRRESSSREAIRKLPELLKEPKKRCKKQGGSLNKRGTGVPCLSSGAKSPTETPTEQKDRPTKEVRYERRRSIAIFGISRGYYVRRKSTVRYGCDGRSPTRNRKRYDDRNPASITGTKDTTESSNSHALRTGSELTSHSRSGSSSAAS